MNIAERFGLTPLIGTAGAIGTWTISIVNEYMAFAIGLATLVYTIGKCIDLFKSMK